MWWDHVQGKDQDFESLGGLDRGRRVDVADAVEGYVHGGCDETGEAKVMAEWYGVPPWHMCQGACGSTPRPLLGTVLKRQRIEQG